MAPGAVLLACVLLNHQADLKSLLGVRLVGVMVLQPGVEESELEPVHFDPSAQAFHHPSRVAQGGEITKVTGLLFSRSS